MASFSTKRRRSSRDCFDGPVLIGMKEITMKEQGSGVFGVVHKGICRGNEVAIKCPKKKKMTKKEFVIFLREIEVMKKNHHPNIVLLMGACLDESAGKIYIVTEWMIGNLARLKEGPHILSTRLDWCYQAACGMSWLHNSHPPLVHHDLKPSNLLYSSSQRIKVCDFGVSQVIPEGEEYILSQPRGTPLYMAPEIIFQEATGISADVYSFGITSWELLTGEDAFKEYHNFQLFKKEVHTKKGKRPKIPEKWSIGMRALITKMWDFRPEERPSFGGIVLALKSLKEQVEFEEYDEELRKNIESEEGIKFWKHNFSPRLEVTWEEFIEKFYEFLGKPCPKDPTELGENPSPSQIVGASPRQLRDLEKKGVTEASREMKRRASQLSIEGSSQMYYIEDICGTLDESQCAFLCLKGLLFISSKNKEGIVDTTKFGLLLLFFGTPSSPFFLEKVTNLLRRDYFHGFLDGPRAATLLCSKPRGTFLVRFSVGRRQVAISKVDSKDSVVHLVVQQVRGKGFRLNKSSDHYWETVDCFIDDYVRKSNLQYPCPGAPFAYLFHQLGIVL